MLVLAFFCFFFSLLAPRLLARSLACLLASSACAACPPPFFCVWLRVNLPLLASGLALRASRLVFGAWCVVLGVWCLVSGPWLRGCLVACLIGCFFFFAFLTQTRTGARVVSALWKCPVPDLKFRAEN